MNETETALWWARVRAAGPQRVTSGDAFPAGMLRLVEPDVTAVWLLPAVPEGAGPGVTEELGLPLLAVEQPNDTARVLAACLRCCWVEPTGPMWPGAPASRDAVASVFTKITNRDEIASHRAMIAAIRRLAAAGWVLWDEPGQTVRLGPRVAAWGSADSSALRELWRLLPPATGAPSSDTGRS
ncbi:hypothetical protein ALI22I_07680 [Saccharothrix sp. ALI-22-I]|uniref:hypothetical protein n=1 Tax=Saccharothrix sp. ALI-22-I TaxID=1933778 RepID=UPI00097C2D45|nr:hypothetical protein [Saccharothrix sp. ALI-22-I]ONI91738.1 hypothetical protein ALI22I_07680 [Saccharothrix sp. ALI-22-I]